jgi:hypothetical protein
MQGTLDLSAAHGCGDGGAKIRLGGSEFLG